LKELLRISFFTVQCLIIIFFILSCKSKHSLSPHQYILESYSIEPRFVRQLNPDELNAYIRQKPPRKLLKIFPFYTWWYYQFNDSVMKAKKKRRDSIYDIKNDALRKKYEKINLKRAEKGKPPREPNYHDKNSPTFLENLRDIGEPIVIHDSEETRLSAENLKKFLFQKGFFINDVTWKVQYKGKKGTVKYYMHLTGAFKVKKVAYQGDDRKLVDYIINDTTSRKIRSGDLCDLDKISQERERITNILQNNGYFDFDPAMIDVEIDTNATTKKANLYFTILNRKNPEDSSSNLPHIQYRISNIYVITEPVISGNYKTEYFPDTLWTKNHQYAFLKKNELVINHEKLSDFIYIHKNSLYKKDSAEATFRALNRIGIFSQVQVYLNKSEEEEGKIICYIVCISKPRQNLSASVEGINTSGNLGTDFSIGYKNINLFKGGEQLHFKIHTSLSAQREFSENKNTIPGYDFYRTFNTILIGPELQFLVPRAFFPFNLFRIGKDMSPATFFKTSLQYQLRSEFYRQILLGNYGFTFSSRNGRFKYEITPAEMLVVKSFMSESFSQDLFAQKDAFLINSFINHINLVGRFSMIYQTRFKRGIIRDIQQYVRLSIESAGNLPRLLLEQFSKAPKDTLGRFTIAGIPFAQFIRTQIEFRTVVPVVKKTVMVYRALGGLGVPLQNLNTLPYEYSFFSGGPNSIRAWRARLLGPGGYDASLSSARFDRIGDILLEGNAELRFPIYQTFYGALFGDVGNIWRLKPDPEKPNGEFLPGKFFNQLAVGAGMGIRWDMQFIILRLDMGIPVKDPSYPEGNRFTFDKQPLKKTVFNFGIGYPF